MLLVVLKEKLRGVCELKKLPWSIVELRVDVLDAAAKNQRSRLVCQTLTASCRRRSASRPPCGSFFNSQRPLIEYLLNSIPHTRMCNLQLGWAGLL